MFIVLTLSLGPAVSKHRLNGAAVDGVEAPVAASLSQHDAGLRCGRRRPDKRGDQLHGIQQRADVDERGPGRRCAQTEC